MQSGVPIIKMEQRTKKKNGEIKTKQSRKLRIIPLGGMGEIGKNLTVLEYGDDIVVVDCGLSLLYCINTLNN